MKHLQDIKNYYNRIAQIYDQDRFGNTYGQYIDRQERVILKNWLKDHPTADTIDIGCGTGRFLDFAQTGVDFSKEMLEVASQKYPQYQFIEAGINDIPLLKNSFRAAFSLHVFMHLDLQTIESGLKEVHRILQPNGVFIFDFPSALRRQLIDYQKKGWHGNTVFDLAGIRELCGQDWELMEYKGILLFPIHRLPQAVRFVFQPIDSLLCRTFLKKYASYYLVKLRKT